MSPGFYSIYVFGPAFILILILLGDGCTRFPPSGREKEGMRLAQAWCACVERHDHYIRVDNLDSVWVICQAEMMDSARYFPYYFKNMGCLADSFSPEELDSLEAVYDYFVVYSDSMCTYMRYGDSLLTPSSRASRSL